MDNLLKNDFTVFNTLPVSTTNIRNDISLTYFEIEDVNRVVDIRVIPGSGTAKYSNPNGENVVIIDYDGFLTSLPHAFQQGKKRCDLIVYTLNDSHFILNELKTGNPNSGTLTKATVQMFSSLKEIIRVPTIAAFINNFTTKKCCYSNKQPAIPSVTISATLAFNRVNSIVTNGLKLSHPQIEALGFELFEYTGNQIISL